MRSRALGSAEQGAAAAAAGHPDEARALVAQAISAREPCLAFWKLPAWKAFWQDQEGATLLREDSQHQRPPVAVDHPDQARRYLGMGGAALLHGLARGHPLRLVQVPGRGHPRYGKGRLSGREPREEWRVATANGMAREALGYLDGHIEDWKRVLVDLCRIPSMSASGFPAEQVRRSAQAVAQALKDAGVEHVQVLTIPGVHPYVYGDWLHRPGRADRAALRASRRPAAGPGGEMALARRRAHRAQWPALRPGN